MGRRMLLAGCGVATLLASACATFTPQPPPESWKPQQSLTPQAGPEPNVPNGPSTDGGGGGGGGGPQTIPPPNGCTRYNPMVIATCPDELSPVVALPADGDPIPLGGERKTGRILRARKGQAPAMVATLKQDSTPTPG